MTDWATSATTTSHICTHANFTANGTLVAVGPTVCGSNRTFETNLNDPGYFPPYTMLCNTWAGITGRACEEIIP